MWGHYAAAVYELEQRKGVKVHDRRGFEEAVAVDGMRRKSDLASRWWEMFVVDERRLAEWLVDETPSRYATRRT